MKLTDGTKDAEDELKALKAGFAVEKEAQKEVIVKQEEIKQLETQLAADSNLSADAYAAKQREIEELKAMILK